jgi:hypothetical protein
VGDRPADFVGADERDDSVRVNVVSALELTALRVDHLQPAAVAIAAAGQVDAALLTTTAWSFGWVKRKPLERPAITVQHLARRPRAASITDAFGTARYIET